MNRLISIHRFHSLCTHRLWKSYGLFGSSIDYCMIIVSLCKQLLTCSNPGYKRTNPTYSPFLKTIWITYLLSGMNHITTDCEGWLERGIICWQMGDVSINPDEMDDVANSMAIPPELELAIPRYTIYKAYFSGRNFRGSSPNFCLKNGTYLPLTDGFNGSPRFMSRVYWY